MILQILTVFPHTLQFKQDQTRVDSLKMKNYNNRNDKEIEINPVTSTSSQKEKLPSQFV